VRHLLGLWVVAQDGARYLRIDPCVPKSWTHYEMTYRDAETVYEITVSNPRGVNRGVARVELDGEEVSGLLIPLTGDCKEHAVRVTLLGG
jgi:cellobiose phosphorylase